MPKKNGWFRENLQKFSLAHWGLFCIFGGTMAGTLSMIQPGKNPGEQAGRSAAVLLFWIIGVVLIVIHFVRRGRSSKETKTPTKKASGKTSVKAKRKPNG